MKDKFNEYFSNQKTRKSLVRLVNLKQGKTVREFIIENFQSAKFSPDSRKVALFTIDGQCFIADTKNDEQKEALLLPLAEIKFGDFSQDGEKFVTATGENIYIFNTSDASLSHKSNVPYDVEMIKDLKEKDVKPRTQTIDFVKFAENNEIKVGRKIFYSGIRENSQGSNNNVFTNTNSISVNISIPTTMTAKLSNNAAQESFTDFGCYRINDNGILVAKSGCGNETDKK